MRKIGKYERKVFAGLDGLHQCAKYTVPLINCIGMRVIQLRNKQNGCNWKT